MSENPSTKRSPEVNATRVQKTLNTRSYADIKKVDPNKIITVYRAVPGDKKIKIEAGDFVTPNRELARFYARDIIGQRGDAIEARIISQRIKAGNLKLHPDHDSRGIDDEFIYNPILENEMSRAKERLIMSKSATLLEALNSIFEAKPKAGFGTDKDGTSYAVLVNGVDSQFFKQVFGRQLDDKRKIHAFQNDPKTKTGYADCKHKSSNMAGVKEYIKMMEPEQFYASWKQNSRYKDDSVKVWYIPSANSPQYPKNEGVKNLTVPQRHQLKIAYRTLELSDVGAMVLGGMTKEEAREIIKKFTGKTPKE